MTKLNIKPENMSRRQLQSLAKKFGFKSNVKSEIIISNINKYFKLYESSIVIVDNIPKVPLIKYNRLYTVVHKIFSQHGKIIDNGLIIPMSEDAIPLTYGYAVVIYKTTKMAENAIANGDDKKLDNKHTFHVNFHNCNKLMALQIKYHPFVN